MTCTWTFDAVLQEHREHGLDAELPQQKHKQQAGAALPAQLTLLPTAKAANHPSPKSDVSLKQLVAAEPRLPADSVAMQAAAQSMAFARISAVTTGAAQDGKSACVSGIEGCVVCWAAEASIILQPCGHM